MDTISDLINREQIALDEKANFVRTHQRKLDAVLALVERIQPNAYITLALNGLDVNLTGDRHQLLALWRGLRALDLHPGTSPKKGDVTVSGYWYHEKSCHTRLLWLYFTSTECRLVKTGTKLVEQPVYETVCGEWQIPVELEKHSDLAEML